MAEGLEDCQVQTLLPSAEHNIFTELLILFAAGLVEGWTHEDAHLFVGVEDFGFRLGNLLPGNGLLM